MKYIKLTLIIIWMAIIFWFSNQKADDSTKLSDGLILKTVRIIEKINHKTYSDEEILNKFVYPVRKAAHFMMYFILGIFSVINFKNDKDGLINAFIICITYAFFDEIHQMLVGSRSREVRDVLIDSISSLLSIILVYRIRKKRD
jgi:VanZ family protein